MLIGAGGTPVERIENQHDIFLSREIRKLHVFLALIFQCEIRRCLTYRYVHYVPPGFRFLRASYRIGGNPHKCARLEWWGSFRLRDLSCTVQSGVRSTLWFTGCHRSIVSTQMIGRTIAHYEILDKLGEGGMGIVYKARDTHLDRLVAIKVLPADKVADPDRKRRFVQEAKAASALNHPNILHVYDIDTSDGLDFMVMEF